MTDAMVDSRFLAMFQSDLDWWIARLDGAPGWPRTLLIALRDEMIDRDAAQVGALPAERIEIYWKLIGERPPDRVDQCPGCSAVAVREPDDYLCVACRAELDHRQASHGAP